MRFQHLLMLYAQVYPPIMEVCAERIATAPDLPAKLGLTKQVSDASRLVMIQQEWTMKFGTSATPVFTSVQEAAIRAHFTNLPWLEFLANMYMCVQALGSEVVEQIVLIADPGTRASLLTPLADELDHIAIGVGRLTRRFYKMGLNVAAMFEAVGTDYTDLDDIVIARHSALLARLMTAHPECVVVAD